MGNLGMRTLGGIGLTAVMLLTLPASLEAANFDSLKTKLDKQESWKPGPSKLPTKFKIKAGTEIDSDASVIKFDDILRDEDNAEAAGLPSTFDWRNRNGKNFLTPPRIQGECGSCVAFAMVASIESRLNIKCSSQNRTFNLSEQYAFSCGGGQCSGGWRMTSAVGFALDHGVPDRPCFPYMAANGEDVSCDMACNDADNRLLKHLTVSRPTTGFIDINAIKLALTKGPLLTNMILFEDLEYYQGGVYRHTAGNQLGGHAVVLVGWDDSQRAWIVRNSWGTEWGEGGYFRVAWDDQSLVGRYTWAFDIEESQTESLCQIAF